MSKAASIKWQSNQRFEAIIDNHIINLGEINHSGALSSQSLLLISLGSSCASELINILKINKLDIDSFEINIEVNKKNNANSVVEKLTLVFVISAKSVNIPNLLNSIETTINQNSSISLLLKKCIEIDYNVFVNGVSINKSDYQK